MYVAQFWHVLIFIGSVSNASMGDLGLCPGLTRTLESTVENVALICMANTEKGPSHKQRLNY